MSGRFFVAKYSWLIVLFVRFFRVIPSSVQGFLFAVSSAFAGRFALLLRYSYLVSVSISIGKSVFVGRFVVVKNFHNARLGENLSIHDMCYIDAQGGLVIGDNVSVAHQVSILTFNHAWSNPELPIKYNPVELKPVVIEDDVWIGCGVRIMPGITVGRRSVIAAGSVVTRDVPRGTLVAGVPARVVRSIVE